MSDEEIYAGRSRQVPDFLRALDDQKANEQPAAESILQEAHRLTHGPRQADYSHPLDDYTRTAALVNALLAHKLKEPLLPEELTLVMCCVKLSRQVHKPKRDNMVDNAGYSWCTDEIIEERARRTKAAAVGHLNAARARNAE